ncbi:MAG: OsmC family protein [Cytophagaceae bacterium]|nr:OsmC family protein [Cytophagaceae bacterium]
MKEYFYEVDLTWNSQRNSILKSHNLPEIKVVSPKPPNENKWTPEHLLAASLSSSWMDTFLSKAEKAKIEIISYQSQCFLKLEKVDGIYKTTEILLRPTIKLISDSMPTKVNNVIEEAEISCPIKNSLIISISIHPQLKYLGKAEKVKANK